MAVLAVLAVLVAMALPPSAALLQRQRLTAAAEALAGDLAEARFEAARRGLVLHIASSGGPAWCWSVAVSAGCDCSELPSSCAWKAVRAADYPGVRLQEPLQARIDPSGSGAPASATLASPRGDLLQVDLTPMGRARICVPGGQPAAAASRYPRC